MRKLACAFLLTLAGAAQAALPRVVLDTPALNSAAPISAPAAVSAALTPSPAAPSLSPLAAPSAFPSLPAAPVPAAPAAAPPAAFALRALPAPAHALPAAAQTAAGPRGIDRLRANAPLADGLADSLRSASLEDAAPAFERNFAAAAGLDGSSAGGTAVPEGSGLPAEHHDLLNRLLQRVRLDDGGRPEQREAMTKAFARMLQSPSARALAERFLADGAPAAVRFEEFEGSRVYEVNGRRIFYAPRAFTEWTNEGVVVRLNRDYLGTDSAFQEQDLPPTLAHELFGHGLWYSRAARENAFQAFHHHELNETNARVVGWLVDFELDGRFEENGAWSYLQDPAGFLAHLKLRLPYYALTFSNEELAKPVQALVARSNAAKAKRARLENELANHKSWNAVIDHFARHHGIAEARLRALRQYMADTEQSYKDEIAVADSLIAEVDATLGRMRAEPDAASERYLQWAATHPMFKDLESETARNTAQLVAMVRETGARPSDAAEDAARARDEHWKGQVTFDELVEMYHNDRRQNPGHWSR